VHVEVPASSANPGPGFDALAVALDLCLTVTVTERGDAHVTSHGEGAEELSRGEDNLVWWALASYCAWAGVAVPEVSLHVRNPIPLARGLGSSAAAGAAGVALGRALTGGGGRDDDLVGVVAELEGHADNAAAAILGGLCVVLDGSAVRTEPTDALRPVLCIPPTQQSTAEARALLPATVALGDAADNGARTALVFAGLSGAVAWDPRAMRDVLHEPARFAAMPGSAALVEELRANGIGACLSGAGPGVLAVVGGGEDGARIRSIAHPTWRVEPLRWNRSGAVVRE
jgi:homoserine kinase